MSRIVRKFGPLGLLVLNACSSLSEAVDADVCLSEETWIDGENGNEFMKPGNACLDCHGRKGGPGFSAAGTVFPALHESDDCFGLEGVEVTLTGSDGKKHKAGTNAAGNFFLIEPIELPFTAKIKYDGKVKLMVTPQSTGDCNSCHTKKGKNGAPGRITPLE